MVATDPKRQLDVDVATTEAFRVFPVLANLLAPGGINGSRGDPYDIPSCRGAGLNSLVTMFAYRLSMYAQTEGYGSLGDIPARDIERVWNQVLTFDAVSSDQREDATALVTHIRSVMPAGMHRSGKALAGALALMADDVLGHGYGLPYGQELTTLAAAPLLLRDFTLSSREALALSGDNTIFVRGANDAIGAFLRYLQFKRVLPSGSVVGVSEPIYSPYLGILRDELELDVVVLRCDPLSQWEPTESDLTRFEDELEEKRRCGLGDLKLFCLVDPNNPTGKAMSAPAKARLSDILRAHRTLVVEDVVYHPFLGSGNFSSIASEIPAQTVVIYSMSKFFHITGARIGFMIFAPEADEWIGERVGAQSFREDFRAHKGPGPNGSLSHTDHVPKQDQWLAIFRLIADRACADASAVRLRERWLAFFTELGVLPPADPGDLTALARFAPYYCLLDFCDLVDSEALENRAFRMLADDLHRGVVSPWSIFRDLAIRGVALLPAARFFAIPTEHEYSFRFSVANQPMEEVRRAAQLVRGYLEDLAAEYAELASPASA